MFARLELLFSNFFNKSTFIIYFILQLGFLFTVHRYHHLSPADMSLSLGVRIKIILCVKVGVEKIGEGLFY